MPQPYFPSCHHEEALPSEGSVFVTFSAACPTVGKREERAERPGRGIRNPFAYAVVIGSNVRIPRSGPRPKQYAMLSRINRMSATDSVKLDTFRARFERIGTYSLLPAYVPENGSRPQMFWPLGISKRSLVIRPAWEIGENDPDGVAIHPDDKPIIPSGATDAHVIRLLDRKKRR
jgi:hypothetical protein